MYLFLISAIFPYVSKNQFLELIPKKKKEGISNLWLKTSVIFGIAWLIMNTLFITFDTSPIIVISFISAVMGFYITYFLPIFMTIKKGDYVSQDEQDEESLVNSLIVTDGKEEVKDRQSESILTEP